MPEIVTDTSRSYPIEEWVEAAKALEKGWVLKLKRGDDYVCKTKTLREYISRHRRENKVNTHTRIFISKKLEYLELWVD